MIAIFPFLLNAMKQIESSITLERLQQYYALNDQINEIKNQMKKVFQPDQDA